jgi:hypothetical protein
MSRVVLVAFLGLSCAPVAAGGSDDAAPRAARSVHLGYRSRGGTAYYNEVTVQQSVPGSYFMCCGFRHGYFGIQELHGGKKLAIFSVWDPTHGDDPRAVADEKRVKVLYKADDVRVQRFGGEGTGGQSFFNYDWKPGQTYRFLVKATVTGEKTAYAAYLFLNESHAWKHLVTFQTSAGGDQLRGLHSFIEDFRRDGRSAQEIRRAEFGNGWVCRDGTWTPLTEARFTASGASWEAKETIDAGAVKDRFYLQTGGDTKRSHALGSVIQRAKGETAPPQMPADF